MRIQELTLWTGELEKLNAFYGQAMGLACVERAPAGKVRRIAFQVGRTKLIFQEADPGQKPFYHIAVTIPENRFGEAKAWAASRVALNTEDGRDDVFFADWNAHSVYFEDPAGNIVELTARHRLNNGTESPFSAAGWLEISEVGIPTNDVPSLAGELRRLGLPCLGGMSDTFAAIGDDDGLFIVVREGRQWFFSKKHAEFFPVRAVVEGLGTFSFERLGRYRLTQAQWTDGYF